MAAKINKLDSRCPPCCNMMGRSWTSKSGVIKLNFRGFSPFLINIFPRRVCVLEHMQFLWSGAASLHDDAISMKSVSAWAKSPWFIAFITRKPFFQNFSFEEAGLGPPPPKKASETKLSFARSCLKPNSSVKVTIILKSMVALAGGEFGTPS